MGSKDSSSDSSDGSSSSGPKGKAASGNGAEDAASKKRARAPSVGGEDAEGGPPGFSERESGKGASSKKRPSNVATPNAKTNAKKGEPLSKSSSIGLPSHDLTS